MQLTLLDILGLDILTIRHSGVRHFDSYEGIQLVIRSHVCLQMDP